jgi:putative membrane protein
MSHLIRPAALAAALITITVVIWPMGPLAAQLFAFHMGQHLVLIALAAPLAVLGGLQWRMRPVFAWVLFVGIFLFWHIPAAFQQAALHHATLLELASILAAAIADGARALRVMTAAVATDLPGVVMLFAPRAICVMPGENAAAFGLTPLEDQQIAGLLMWVPANLAFFGIATFLFARWIRFKANTA